MFFAKPFLQYFIFNLAFLDSRKKISHLAKKTTPNLDLQHKNFRRYSNVKNIYFQ